ncbi:hypothetical protein SAMD00079811_24380 [Scytonema sp. HK-05]|nr:hypothetical protein SAMD00079811_24380 [Scytonema sp. HK-05]
MSGLTYQLTHYFIKQVARHLHAAWGEPPALALQ